MKINDKELNVIIGGGIGATFINYLTDAFKTIYSIGQDLGGAIRRIATGKTCPV
jgi:bacteriocin-like protein